MTTITAAAPATSATPPAPLTAGKSIVLDTDTKAMPLDDGTDMPPEYFDLQERRGTLENEIHALEAEQWRRMGSANVGMTLAAMFRRQEESAADDAISNGETPVPSSMSSIMMMSARVSTRSAGDTIALSNLKKDELIKVNTQIAEIDKNTLSPTPKPAVATT